MFGFASNWQLINHHLVTMSALPLRLSLIWLLMYVSYVHVT